MEMATWQNNSREQVLFLSNTHFQIICGVIVASRKCPPCDRNKLIPNEFALLIQTFAEPLTFHNYNFFHAEKFNFHFFAQKPF